MMIRSVLVPATAVVVLVASLLGAAECRRLIDDMDNEIGGDPGGMPFRNEPTDWVNISQPPVPIISKNVGDHVEFHCEAMGSPPPTIQWYKRNKRITENLSVESNLIDSTPALSKVSSRLVINYVLPLHQDIYRCVAESGSQMVSAPTKLVVNNKEGKEMNFTQLINAKIVGAYHLPRVTFWASSYLDDSGSDIILPCKSVGNPKPNLVWIDPNQKIIGNDNRFSVLPDGELRIRNLVWADMGVYTCVVENSIGEDSVETFLYPMTKPRK